MNAGRQVFLPVCAACSLDFLLILLEVMTRGFQVCKTPFKIGEGVVEPQPFNDLVSLRGIAKMLLKNLQQVLVFVFDSSVMEGRVVLGFKLLKGKRFFSRSQFGRATAPIQFIKQPIKISMMQAFAVIEY